jgi:peptidoglycan/xylan/chitin deacetylase (PgdA/CDA1 family)
MHAKRIPHALTFSFLLICSIPASAAKLHAVGATRIAKWHDNKKAVFLLMFDDSWPSHLQVAVPALVQRNMTATFYINPGKGEYKRFRGQWEKEAWKAGMVYGNHTMTHQGVRDMEDAEREIGGCTEAILGIIPGRKPRLMSWARPGVGKDKWNISKEQLAQVLEKHRLVSRPPFAGHGAVYHLKTAEQMLSLADKAISEGNMEYVIFHGIERRTPLGTKYQDFWPFNQDEFFALLDQLKIRRDRDDLWITDHISYHQYLTERTTARVKIVKASESSIVLQLTCDADPEFHDLPLTLTTRVPVGWTRCRITHNKQTHTAIVENGDVRFDAQPDGKPIQLQPSPAVAD